MTSSFREVVVGHFSSTWNWSCNCFHLLLRFFFVFGTPTAYFLFHLNNYLIMIILGKTTHCPEKSVSSRISSSNTIFFCIFKIPTFLYPKCSRYLLVFCRIMRIRSGSLLEPNCGWATLMTSAPCRHLSISSHPQRLSATWWPAWASGSVHIPRRARWKDRTASRWEKHFFHNCQNLKL